MAEAVLLEGGRLLGRSLAVGEERPPQAQRAHGVVPLAPQLEVDRDVVAPVLAGPVEAKLLPDDLHQGEEFGGDNTNAVGKISRKG